MPSTELLRLWKLAQIDRQILEIRTRAASLGIDARTQAQHEVLKASEQETGARAKELKGEITDLELSQKTDEAKIKKIDKELFGGKVVNPREVANLEKEIEITKRKRDQDADRLLELYDRLPPVNEAWERAKAALKAHQELLTQMRQKAEGTKKDLESAFHKLATLRPEAVKGVPPTLLAKYEAIRKNHGGIAMVEVDRKTGNCGGCGMHLPDRTIQQLKEDKTVVCEACHRILYYTEGAV